jgi:gliding motility-associated-like protein
MRNSLLTRATFLLLFITTCFQTHAQYVRSSHVSFSPQELIEDILFSSNCVDDVQLQESISGNFNDGMLSYGFFESVNSDFPFENGIVLSTGRLSNIEGPNDSLSDDTAPGWIGDADLEEVLGLTSGETINATVLRFTFTPKAQNISFRYIFASEEYRDNNRTTCDFSDAFAFLIRPQGSQSYNNIAVVPGTDTPVAVTTVRPQIGNFCDAINEEFFGQFNPVQSAIGLNGQTDVLTAEAQVIPNQTYEVKLVIADEGNARFDSAVFLEANSFNVGFNLGNDRTGFNSLCQDDALELEIPSNLQSNPVTWFFNGNPIPNETSPTYTVSEANLGSGTYSAEVILGNDCTATDSIEINFESPTQAGNLALAQCTSNEPDVFFNLNSIVAQLNAQGLNLVPVDYFENLTDAENATNPINSPESYEYSNQNVFVRLSNSFGCVSITEIELSLETTLFPEITFETCSPSEETTLRFDVFATLNRIRDESNVSGTINLYRSQADAANANDPVTGTTIILEKEDLPSTYFARVSSTLGCDGLIPVRFDVTPQVEVNDPVVDLLFCREDTYIVLESEFDDINYEFSWSTGETSSSISVSEPGTYEVTIDLVNAPSQNCSATKTFNVEVSSIAELDYRIFGFPGNYTVEILATGEGDYEYALNSSAYQESPIFSNLESFNTAKVRDKLGCGNSEISFSTLVFPEFFTPNGDGINDVWIPEGISTSGFELITIDIFDRYGKLISVLRPNSNGWDGTFNGRNMPQEDYWYKVRLTNGTVMTGSFTLKR